MEIQPSAARPRRKPLQPLNSLPDPPASRIIVKPKPPPPPIWPMPAENRPAPASLAEELEAIRRRNERLRLERDRTEAALRARDEALERGMREMERRWVEQKRLEQELARVVKLKELGSSFRMSSPFKSLREIELEKRRLESPIKVVESTCRDKQIDGNTEPYSTSRDEQIDGNTERPSMSRDEPIDKDAELSSVMKIVTRS